MSTRRFLLFSALGSFLWCTFLALAGYWLEGSYEQVNEWLNPASMLIVLGLIGIYLWRVIRWRPDS